MPKQVAEETEFPGMEAPKIDAIERAGRAFCGLSEDSWELREKRQNALAKVLAVMKENSVDKYRLKDGTVLTLVEKESVKIKRSRGESVEVDPDDED